MAKTNMKDKPVPVYTHGGARAVRVSKELELRRTVAACMLWEDTFYESGVSVADRISALVRELPAQVASQVAIDARQKWNLRHAPLWIVVAMVEAKYTDVYDRQLIAYTINQVIQRPDELGELVSLYWKTGKRPLTKQMKLGLADAFAKFSEYSLAKYNSDSAAVRLRDVLFMVHAKPTSVAQTDLYRRVASNQLATPDTWEVQLSGGGDKKEVFTRLLNEGKLGYMALLRNLRNMYQAGVSKSLVNDALLTGDASKVLPFRFISAASSVPAWEDIVSDAFVAKQSSRPKLKGKTIVVVDVSGSMYGGKISAKSDMDRARAACALAAVAREMFEDVVIYATGGNDYTRQHKTEQVPSRRGIPLADAIYNMCRPLGGGGIFLTPVVNYLREVEGTADRILVITDEQDCAVADADRPSMAKPFGKHNYILNVGTYKNGVGYGSWTHIDGFSGSTIEYIRAFEEISSNNS